MLVKFRRFARFPSVVFAAIASLAPLLAGVFGLAGNAAQQVGGRTFWLAKHHKHLYKIAGQCNGYTNGKYTTCAGWGSPDGVGAL